MLRTVSIRAIAGLVAGVAIIGCGAGCGPIHPVESAPAAKPVVRIAIMPRYSPYTMGTRFMPLVKYLRQETGYDVSYVSAVGYRGFLQAVEGGDADFVFANPVAYLILRKTRGAYPLVTATEPDLAGGPARSEYRGVILARTDSDITRLSDLKGKIIAAGSEMAVAGYLAPKMLCRQHGLDIDKEATVTVCPTQEQVIRRLGQGRAAAGFVREAIWQEAAAANPDIRPIEYTPMYPGWCMCAMGDTDPAIAESVKQALLKLDYRDTDHSKVLIPVGFRDFVEARDQDYQPVRMLLANLGMPY